MMRKINFILIGCLVVFIAVTFFLMRGISYGKYTEGFGAAFYPALLLGLLSVFVIILFIQTLRLPEDKKDDKKEKSAKQSVFSNITFRSLSIFLMLLFIYAFTLEIMGFILDSFLFVLIGMVYLKVRVKQALVVSFSVVGILYILFRILLRVPLPSGLLGVIGL